MLVLNGPIEAHHIYKICYNMYRSNVLQLFITSDIYKGQFFKIVYIFISFET